MMNVCVADPVTVAAWLSVTDVHAVARIVVPPGTLGPLIVEPSKAALQPVTVAVVEPKVVFMFNATVMLGGTLLAVQLPLATATVAPMAVPVHCASARKAQAASRMKTMPTRFREKAELRAVFVRLC